MQASEAVEKECNTDRIHAFPATPRVSGLLLPPFPPIRNVLDRSQMSESRDSWEIAEEKQVKDSCIHVVERIKNEHSYSNWHRFRQSGCSTEGSLYKGSLVSNVQ